MLKDFHQRVASYQAWYNLVRPNSNKDDKCPWQIIKKVRPKMNLELVKLPPMMSDWLGPDYITRDELSLRVYDLPCYPLLQKTLWECTKGLDSLISKPIFDLKEPTYYNKFRQAASP